MPPDNIYGKMLMINVVYRQASMILRVSGRPQPWGRAEAAMGEFVSVIEQRQNAGGST
jgi:hypothetical protein